MEVNGVAAALEYYAFQIVIENAANAPSPVVEGMHVAEEKILQRLIQEEFQPQGSAVGKREDESGQSAAGAADDDLPEGGPVRLALLTGKGAQTQKSFSVRGAELGHDAPELADAAGVTARANHLEQPGGAQAGILLEGLAKEIQVGVEETIPQTGMVVAEALGLQGPAYGLGMQAEFRGNGADLPVFGIKQMTDASDLFVGNHAAPPKRD